MKIVMFGNGSGSQYWRLVDPALLMHDRGVDVSLPQGGITEDNIRTANIVVLQGCIDRQGIALCYAYQQERGLRVVVDQDDDIKIEADNPNAQDHELYVAGEVVSKTVEIADLVTTTTPYLAKKLSKINPKVKVLPNYMSKRRWNLNKRYGQNDKIRIGWVGSTTHLKDIELIKPLLEDVLKNRKDVEIIFMGDPRIKGLLGLNIEVALGVPFDFYPSRLFGLNLDIGLAPLLDTEFNRNKSPIKALEYGICSIPVVASSVEPYNSLKGYIGLAKNRDEFGTLLTRLLEDENYRLEQGKRLKEHVLNNFMLEDHILEWIETFKELVYDKNVPQVTDLQTR